MPLALPVMIATLFFKRMTYSLRLINDLLWAASHTGYYLTDTSELSPSLFVKKPEINAEH
jgi:hypothetical protein